MVLIMKPPFSDTDQFWALMPDGLIPGSEGPQNTAPSELTKPSLHLVPQNSDIKKPQKYAH